MKAEQLLSIADAIRNDLTTAGLLKAWRQLVGAVENQVNAPNPAHVAAVVAAKQSFENIYSQSLAAKVPPSWRSMLESLGMGYYINGSLPKAARELYEENQLNLGEKLATLKEYLAELEADHGAFESISSGMARFNIEADDLPAGEAEIAATIPRSLFGNDLAGLADEVGELDHLLQTLGEAVTGGAVDSPKIRSFSTTDPIFWVSASWAAAYAVAKLFDKVADGYLKVLQIKKTKLEMQAAFVDQSELTVFDRQAEKQVEVVVKSVIEWMRRDYLSKLKDRGRANELEVSLNSELKKLVAKIDRGYRLEGRVNGGEETADEAGATAKAAQLTQAQLKELGELLAKARKFEVVGEPVLPLPKPAEKKRRRRSKGGTPDVDAE